MSQQDLYLRLKVDGALPSGIDYDRIYSDPVSRTQGLNYLIKDLVNEGYLTASLDTSFLSADTLIGELYVGAQFEWARLGVGNASEDVLSLTGYRDKLFRDKQFEPAKVYQLFDRVLTHYENTGYPFASIRFDSVRIEDEGISAVLNIQPNTFIQIDSLIIKGDASVNQHYIEQYLGIRPGDPYSEELLQAVMGRLRSIPFISVPRAPEVSFTLEGANLYIYINKRKASDINGILGLQPDENGKVTITGDAKLGLKNAFKHGETILFEWRQLQTQTQDLQAMVDIPFIFNTAFGTDVMIKLYKRDTSFLEVNRDIGLQYHFSGDNYVRAFFNWYSSDLISTDNLVTTTLPDYADVSSTSYGVGVHLNSLDYRFNPRSGLQLILNGSTGFKNITKNPDLDEALYDDIALRSIQYHVKGKINYFIPLFKTSTIMVGAKGGMLLNENMFDNEMFRFGGLKDLRGFDQETLLASSFVIGTFEYRLLFEENSNIHAFADVAWYEKNTVTDFVTDTPIGFGLGVSFQTGAGIFSLNYALGKQLDNPILLKAGKVHFGFISLF